MKVNDVMMRTPASCSPDTNLAAAVEILWNRNCGILPVVDSDTRVFSVITDRDICIALGTRNRLPGEIMVSDVVNRRAICCSAEEGVKAALARMAEAKVRRLPVVDADGKLVGILSMDDAVDRTDLKPGVKGNELTSEDVVSILKKLYAPQLPVAANKAAVA